MITPPQLAAAFARNTRLMHMQADGLTHADSLIQPPVRGNCFNWVLGHLALSRDEILDELGQPRVLPPEATSRYERGEEPVGSEDDRALPLADLLAALTTSQERIDAVLNAATDADMARPIKWGENERPLGDYLFFMYFHDSYHAGQTELLRQLAGKDDQVIK